jgi:hypothetical protein
MVRELYRYGQTGGCVLNTVEVLKLRCRRGNFRMEVLVAIVGADLCSRR